MIDLIYRYFIIFMKNQHFKDVKHRKAFQGAGHYNAKQISLASTTVKQRNTILYVPALQKKVEDINQRAADMWSFAMVLWELSTREVPFAEMSAMEIGMKVSLPSIY